MICKHNSTKLNGFKYCYVSQTICSISSFVDIIRRKHKLWINDVLFLVWKIRFYIKLQPFKFLLIQERKSLSSVRCETDLSLVDSSSELTSFLASSFCVPPTQTPIPNSYSFSSSPHTKRNVSLFLPPNWRPCVYIFLFLEHSPITILSTLTNSIKH